MMRFPGIGKDEAEEAEFNEKDESLEEDAPDNPRRHKASAFEKTVTQKILSKTLLHTFRLTSGMLKSSATFTDNEFDEPAKDILDVVNRFKMLRFVVNIWHPLISASRLWEKGKKIKDGREPGKSKDGNVSRGTVTGAHGEESLGGMFVRSDEQF